MSSSLEPENWIIRIGSDFTESVPDEELSRRRHRVMAVLVSSSHFDRLEPVPTEDDSECAGVVLGDADHRGDIVIRCTEEVADAISSEIQNTLGVTDCYSVAYGPQLR